MVLAQGISFEKEKEDSWNCQGGGIESFFAWFVFRLVTAVYRRAREARGERALCLSVLKGQTILDPWMESAQLFWTHYC